MLSKNLAGKSLPELQKALMGGDPTIEPYQALAAIEKMVKSEKAKTAQMAQQQRPQGMVAQRTLAEAAALRNPYMAAGLGAAPVPSPVSTPMGEQAPQEAPVGMAGGGMVAFQEGGNVQHFQVGGSSKAKASDSSVYMPQAFDNTIAGLESGDLYAQAMAKLQAGLPLNPQEKAAVGQTTQFAPPSRLPGTNMDVPAAFNNKVEGFQAGNRYAQEMGKIKDEVDAKKNAPMSGQGKALTYLSAPAAMVGDVLASPVNLIRNAVRNPMDNSPKASYTPFSDARTMALSEDFGGKALREMRDSETDSTKAAGAQGFEAQMAEKIATLEKQTGRKLSEGQKDVFRRQELTKLVKDSKGVKSTADMAMPETIKSDKGDKAGLPGAAAARANVSGASGAGTGGGATRAPAGLGAAAGRGGYDVEYSPQSREDRIKDIREYKKEFGANNAELLAPLEKYQLKYEQDAEKAKGNAVSDALIAAGLGTLAGTSQFAGANIGQGGLKGLEAYQNSQKAYQTAQDKMLQSRADMVKSRISLEKGDETAAIAAANHGRQEAKDAAQFKMLGMHYANSDAAQMLQAQAYMARANAAGGGNDDKHMIALTRVRGLLNQDEQYKQLAKMAAFSGPMGQKARTDMAAMEQKLYQQLAPELLTKTGGNTMQASPAGGGGGAKFLGFES